MTEARDASQHTLYFSCAAQVSVSNRPIWYPLSDTLPSVFTRCQSPHLVQEGLEHVAGLADGDHAGGARVVHTVVEIIDAACIHDLFPAIKRVRQTLTNDNNHYSHY